MEERGKKRREYSDTKSKFNCRRMEKSKWVQVRKRGKNRHRVNPS